MIFAQKHINFQFQPFSLIEWLEGKRRFTSVGQKKELVFISGNVKWTFQRGKMLHNSQIDLMTLSNLSRLNDPYVLTDLLRLNNHVFKGFWSSFRGIIADVRRDFNRPFKVNQLIRLKSFLTFFSRSLKVNRPSLKKFSVDYRL